MCVAVCLHGCLSTTCMQGQKGPEYSVRTPGTEWNYRWLGSTIWVLVLSLGPLLRAASTLNHTTFSPELPFSLFEQVSRVSLTDLVGPKSEVQLHIVTHRTQVRCKSKGILFQSVGDIPWEEKGPKFPKQLVFMSFWSWAGV